MNTAAAASTCRWATTITRCLTGNSTTTGCISWCWRCHIANSWWLRCCIIPRCRMPAVVRTMIGRCAFILPFVLVRRWIWRALIVVLSRGGWTAIWARIPLRTTATTTLPNQIQFSVALSFLYPITKKFSVSLNFLFSQSCILSFSLSLYSLSLSSSIFFYSKEYNIALFLSFFLSGTIFFLYIFLLETENRFFFLAKIFVDFKSIRRKLPTKMQLNNPSSENETGKIRKKSPYIVLVFAYFTQGKWYIYFLFVVQNNKIFYLSGLF